jgi:hypothetical protein
VVASTKSLAVVPPQGFEHLSAIEPKGSKVNVRELL